MRKERDAVRGREGEKEEKEFKGFVEEAREVVRCAICGKKTDRRYSETNSTVRIASTSIFRW